MAETIAPISCRKCGATSSRNPGDPFCAACLLEAALIDGGADEGASPVLMEFGEYELLEELGRGGQGVVYRARHKGLNRIVALKVIGLGHWATEAHLKRFRMEAEAAAKLDHPCIVPIYDIGERDGACFFSMKFIEGAQLDEAVRRTPLSLRAAAGLMAKVARTVHHAHEHGVLHRDIKPGNILIDRNGDPHLTDFGLARLVEKESNVTRTMDVLGTPSYMAPEQAQGQKHQLTSATDVYGLGAVLFHLLTLRPPFAGGTTYETIKLVCETEAQSPRLYNPKVDRDLATICLKCLDKDPTRRYRSALVLAEDLERWLGHEPITARPAGPVLRMRKWIRRNPVLATAVPLGVALLMALASLIRNQALEQGPPAGIAILPFDNLSDDKADALLADGLQDDILTKLAKVAQLKVISRTSVMGYRGERNIRKIGSALHVSHVLEGSVHKVDGRIRVNAQLIDARTDTHVWAETYERNRADIFTLESDIVQAIAARLNTRLSNAEKIAIEQRPTSDLEAYDLYRQGREILQNTDMGMDADPIAQYEKAVDLLQQAVGRDPRFSLAWSSLAEACLYRYWNPLKPTEWRDRAEAALNRARELAPDAGETHLARALLFYWGYLEYDRALEELEFAARALPNNAQVLRVTCWVERRLGRWKESLRHGLRAAEIDPRDVRQKQYLVRDHARLRRYREALQLADQVLADFPDDENIKVTHARVLLDSGDLPGARVAIDRAASIPPFTIEKLNAQFFLCFWERNYAEAQRLMTERSKLVHHEFFLPESFFEGMLARAQNDNERASERFANCRDELRAKLRDRPDISSWRSALAVAEAALGEESAALQDEARARALAGKLPEHDNILDLALIYCWLGQRDQALAELEKVVKTEVGASYGDLRFSPVWDSLREDPRFDKILEAAAKPLL